MIYIAIILICAELWRRGGDGQSLFRNPLVPIILSLGKFYLTGYNWWVLLYIPLMWGAIQAFSYGLSSPIHKLVVWIFKRGEDGNNQVVEIVTRAICGLLWSLPASVFALFEGSLTRTINGNKFRGKDMTQALFTRSALLDLAEHFPGSSYHIELLR